jgi:glycosyltransferase involved in cell wall biosynthesis
VKIAFVSLSGLPYHVAGVSGAYGGAEAQMAVLASALRGRGHEVVLIVTDYDDAAKQGRRLTDLPLLNAYNRRDGIPGLRFFTPRWRGLDRAIADANADVVFTMCADMGTGQVAHSCRRRGTAFVFATASDSDVDPAKVRLGVRAKFLYEWGLRRADRIITQHTRQAALLEQKYGLLSTPIPLGVELPAGTAEPSDPPYVLWLGTLRRVKRPDRWLDLAERFPGTRFVMAGGRAASEPQVFDETAARARSLANVDFRGPVEDIADVLTGAWVLLNTSDVEGFPTTFLEAWARGIPVVSLFDPDGLVARHRLGWIAEDDAGLERDLGTCLGDRILRDAAGARARDYVVREHAPEAVAERVEAVLTAAVQRR